MSSLNIVFLVYLTLHIFIAIHCHKVHDVENEYQQAVNHQPQHHQQHHNQQPTPAAHQQQHHDPMSDHINKDHVLEHLDGIINKPKEQMTVDEQNFYYFKLHDYDNNNMLDGLELVSAFAHNDGKKK